MDRHEYEINQLINPKKDIVKSNSKHRDKIETLILGRRIGGITRGGETPEKTLWKKVIDASGGSIFCETRGKDVMVITKNSQGNMPTVKKGVISTFFRFPDDAIANYLVKPLNAKGYNLPSSGWLEEITKLNVGDPIPKWNEYKEI